MISSATKVVSGTLGTATEVAFVLDDTEARYGATVAAWLLHVPGQSPAWDDYMLVAVHLRDQEGVVDVVEGTDPEATHEVLLFALDPGEPVHAENMGEWRRLSPVNVAETVKLPSDKAAEGLLELCARAVIIGVLPAEPALAGQVEPWRSTLRKTAEHITRELAGMDPHGSES